jgi:hypothetical protein
VPGTQRQQAPQRAAQIASLFLELQPRSLGSLAPCERQVRRRQLGEVNVADGSVAGLRELRLTDPRIHETGPPESGYSSATPSAASPTARPSARRPAGVRHRERRPRTPDASASSDRTPDLSHRTRQTPRRRRSASCVRPPRSRKSFRRANPWQCRSGSPGRRQCRLRPAPLVTA